MLMMDVVAHPVIVFVDNSSVDCEQFSNKVYDGSYITTPDHALLVVGGRPNMDGAYWIVKNSYGCGLGDRGYIYM
jgi:C1A family cysteine protease